MSSPYKTAAVHTLGCKVNFTETSMISQKFQKHGISVVPFDEIADIYVINTCSVTENANIKCDKLVKSLKRKNPDAYIAVTGCYAQLKSKELSKNKDIGSIVNALSAASPPYVWISSLMSIKEAPSIVNWKPSISVSVL